MSDATKKAGVPEAQFAPIPVPKEYVYPLELLTESVAKDGREDAESDGGCCGGGCCGS